MKGAKKAYALLSRRDGVVVKGFEAARRDRAPIARTVQLRILELLAKESEGPRQALPGILEIVRSEAARIQRGGAELGELPITAKLQRHPRLYANPPPAHVIAALKLAKAGYQVRIGGKVSYIKLGPSNAAPMELVEWPGPYYRESYAQDVLRAAHRVLCPLGVRPRDIATPGTQTNLLNYAGAACQGCG